MHWALFYCNVFFSFQHPFVSLTTLPVEAKRRSRYRGPACPVAPRGGTGTSRQMVLG